MDRYYIMIDEPGVISMKSKFFTVAVGDTPRCKRQLEWLRKWCWENNAFFAIRSHSTDVFMLNIAESLGTKVYLIPKLSVKVSALVAHIKNFNCTPVMPPTGHNEVYLRKQTDPKFYILCNTSSRKRLTYKT